MWKGQGRSCLAALAILAAGCATYRPDPLRPEAEAAALDRQDLATLVPQRSTPGEGPAAPGVAPFDLFDGLNEAEVVDAAKAGEPWALHELLDRCLGKPHVQIEFEADIGEVRQYNEREAVEARRIARFLLENPAEEA